MSSISPLVKNWLPPALLRVARHLRVKGIRFEGDYKTWEEAAKLCTGYDADSILDKVLEATLKVKRGEAVFERDSVLFDEIQYSWPVTAALMWAAARNNGELHVLDFGGSLGSSYFQNKKFLSQLREISWTVVEQRKFVGIGKIQISDSVLDFSSTIDECYTNLSPNLALLSSVLQYLSNPFAVLESLAQRKIGLIVVDRTPFSNDKIERIKIQHVPKNIYSASYPCWFFSRDNFVQKMISLNYHLVESFDALDKLSDQAKWQGMIFEKAEHL
jgi:putative methyltransferase (TIGR04325 family)